jgi:nucleoside phosphorylase
VNASGVAASLRSSFTSIKLALIVGICGGAPFGIDNKNEIYLGDLIISTALIQYDFGRQYPEVFERKDTLEHTLGRPSQKIRTSLAKLTTYHYRQKLQDDIVAHLKVVQRKMPEAKHPGFKTDRLSEPSYLHKHYESVTGRAYDICNSGNNQICPAALKMNCDKLGCDKARLVVRSRPTDGGESSGGHKPTVHFGKMGSADTVMKSGEDRDRIVKADRVIAFEMEGAGVCDHFPSTVIKGVCDYADSHKNKEWQDYAAAVAAAGMKAFLKEWAPEEKPAEQGKLFIAFTQLIYNQSGY